MGLPDFRLVDAEEPCVIGDELRRDLSRGVARYGGQWRCVREKMTGKVEFLVPADRQSVLCLRRNLDIKSLAFQVVETIAEWSSPPDVKVGERTVRTRASGVARVVEQIRRAEH